MSCRNGNVVRIAIAKIFTDIEIENALVDSINNIDTGSLIYVGGDSILNGSVIFKKPVHITEDLTLNSGLVNQVNLKNEIVQNNRRYEGNPVGNIFNGHLYQLMF